MIVKLMPTKQLFFNSENGYRVLSCLPVYDPFEEDVKDVYPELVLNSYNNFTLNGSNITNLQLKEEYELEIREDKRSKYPASYVMVCWAGIDIDEDIKIAPEQEVKFLSQFMEKIQSERIHKAYPNFVQMIIDGKEEEIDYHNIEQVGPVRFEKYVNDVKGHFHSLKYLPILSDWEITDDKHIDTLVEAYATPEELKEAFDSNPYHIFFDLLHFPFTRTDRAVLNKRPELIDSKERCEYGCMEILRQSELDGDTRMDSDLMMEMAEELIPECADKIPEVVNSSELIHYDSDMEYASFESTYQAEQTIAECLLDRINNPEPMEMDWAQFTTVDGFECTEQQSKILQLANNEKFCMLNGNAGSGKSSAMKALVLMLEYYNKSYVQLAPTGKASARLRETTGRPASTIHMYLVREDSNFCPDYIIVDEASMIGVELFARLLKSISKDTRIVFVCDEAQLASISCGNVVQDIIDSGVVPTAKLTKIFRYGTSGLATIATDTRNGKLGIRTENGKYDDYKFYKAENPITQIVDIYGKLLEEGYHKDDILILCPFNKGKQGTYEINKAIQTRYNDHVGKTASYEIKGQATIMFKIGDKVINTHNNYNMPSFQYDEDGSMVESAKTMFVANGDIGYVRHIKETSEGVVMAVEFDNGIACVKGSDINNLLLGYAISIHKSQGSQSKVVIMYTDKAHKRMLSKNLLYVGDSRAQEMLIEIGDIEAIKEGLQRSEEKERDTWLKEMLENG